MHVVDRCFARFHHVGLKAVLGRAAVPARGRLHIWSVGLSENLTVQVIMPKRRLAIKDVFDSAPLILAEMEVCIAAARSISILSPLHHIGPSMLLL